MANATGGFKAFRTYLEMIKFEHSVFALPFAMVGMLWGSLSARDSAWPGFWIFFLIVVCMVTARSAAMAYNRIADREIDAVNPRTQMRALPAGLLTLRHATLFFYGSCALFFFCAALLGPWPLALSPVALFTILFYSHTKRFTQYSHFVLGASLGIAPAAAWVASAGGFGLAVLPLSLGVLLWTSGFDIIYSLQDEEFDREQGLRSLPQSIGKEQSLMVSRWCHVLAIVMLGFAVWFANMGPFSWAGVFFAAILLFYEQSLVKPDDLSRVNIAFFTLNGFVSIGFFVFVLLDVLF
ncbi:MAG TPA: UbiA-like polyprenyltransferase [Fimbriimonadaceae bacterium]|nr:UbiA-like polyprenyltransferase [Fimbriimonadaceae bacterium]